MPGRVVLLQREIEFEGRYGARVALYFRQLATHTVRLETDEQRAASVTNETHTFLDFPNSSNELNSGEFNMEKYSFHESRSLFSRRISIF